MDSIIFGICAVTFSFCFGYGLRRSNLKWEGQARAAERQAAMRAEQLQATVSASLDGIIVIDADGNVVDFSESAERIFGYKRADIMGTNMAELIVPERYRDAHNAGMKRMRDSGQSKILGQRIEIEAMRADGSEFMSELAISQSSSENGEIFIAYIRNISERIAAQKDLVKAKEAAEAANEAKSRFLATMSHEIRTPFNAVLGILDILSETKLDEEQQHLVKTAESSSVALLRVINDVLDYARMSSGQAKLISRPFRANAVFDDVIKLFESQAKDKGLDIKLNINAQHDNIYLEGDIGRIRQVLLNYVSNAIKFTDEGTLSLHISLTPMDDGHQLLKCSISDTGIGIDSGVLRNLFDEFFMVDDSDSREFGGTGLGLTISKGLAELMGGELGCESELGHGSTFWLSVPLQMTTPAAVTDRYEKKAFDMKNCRILVAEDNPTNQMVIRHSLKNRCAELTVVDNGLQALHMLEEKTFDLILMDIFMPEMTGKETTRIIRASNNEHRDIPIIALTAMGSFQDLDALRDDGVNEVVIKPFKKEDLFAAISSVLGQEEPKKPDTELEFGGYADQLDADEIPIFSQQLKLDLEKITDEFRAAQKSEKWGELLRPSHTLKGLAGTYGMHELSNLAKNINIDINERNFSAAPEQVSSALQLLSLYLDNLDNLFHRAKAAA